MNVATDRGVAPAAGYQVEVPASGIVEHDFVLEAGGSIAGTVLDQDGAPVAGVVVQARTTRAQIHFGPQDELRTDGAGAFAIAGLEPGTYQVVATRDFSPLHKPGTTDYATQGEKTTVKANQTATVKLVVERERGTIAGSVEDAAGAPVTDAYLAATRESDAAGASGVSQRATARWFSESNKPVLTSADGTFALTKLAPGKYLVRAFRRGGGETVVEHVAVGATGVKLQLKATGSIEGLVTRAGGAPLELTLTVADVAQGFSREETYFRSNGAFAVTDLPAGHFRVTAAGAGGQKSVVVDVAAAGRGEARRGGRARRARHDHGARRRLRDEAAGARDPDASDRGRGRHEHGVHLPRRR